MSEYQPYTGTIPGCRLRMIKVKTARLQEYEVLARFAANIKGVTAWKEVRPVKCYRVYCEVKSGS